MPDDVDDPMMVALRGLPRLKPSADLPRRFAERARRETRRSELRWLIGMAAGLILMLGAGWWQERRAREAEVLALRTELQAAIADVSAARRLVAMNEIGRAQISDGITTALLTVALLTDDSPSVRIAAIEALGTSADASAFSTAVNQSLASEMSPLVQSAILRSLQRLPISERHTILKAFLTRVDIEPIVRTDAQLLTKS